jgi:hypothetical protein
MVGSCEYSDEPLGSGTMELVSYKELHEKWHNHSKCFAFKTFCLLC